MSGTPEQGKAPTQVAGTSGGGAADALAQLLQAVKGLEALVGGISGGGPGQITPPGGKVEQVRQVGQVHGDHGFGKHDGKPGWGNGGFGPPGLMKKMQHHDQTQVGGIQQGKPDVGGVQQGNSTQVAGVQQGKTDVAGIQQTDVAGIQQGDTTQVAGLTDIGIPVDPRTLQEVAAPEGAPTTDKSGAKIRYFVHAGDQTPRPMSEAMIKYFGIGG